MLRLIRSIGRVARLGVVVLGAGLLIGDVEGVHRFLGDSIVLALEHLDQLMQADQGVVAPVAQLANLDGQVAAWLPHPVANGWVSLLVVRYGLYRDLHIAGSVFSASGGIGRTPTSCKRYSFLLG